MTALTGCCEYTHRVLRVHPVGIFRNALVIYSAGYVSALLALQQHLVGVEITLTHNNMYMHTKNVRDS